MLTLLKRTLPQHCSERLISVQISKYGYIKKIILHQTGNSFLAIGQKMVFISNLKRVSWRSGFLTACTRVLCDSVMSCSPVEWLSSSWCKTSSTLQGCNLDHTIYPKIYQRACCKMLGVMYPNPTILSFSEVVQNKSSDHSMLGA